MEFDRQAYISYLQQSENLNNTELSSLARDLAFNEKKTGLRFHINALSNIANDTEISNKIRFTAWYALFLSMRRNKSATVKLTKLVDDYQNYFSGEVLFKISKAIVLMRQSEFINAISLIEDALNSDNTNLGFIATFVDVSLHWAYCIESTEPVGSQVWIKTKRLIVFLLDQNPTYAKYQFFYSQYLLIEKDLIEAERRVLLAIDNESEESSDYLLRLSDYQAHYLKVRTAFLEAELNNELNLLSEAHIELKESQQKFYQEMEVMKAELKDNQKQNFQFITVFIAVISILLSSLKAFTFTTTENLIEFMLVMALSLLLFFSTLFGLISTNSKVLKVIFILMGIISPSILLYFIIR